MEIYAPKEISLRFPSASSRYGADPIDVRLILEAEVKEIHDAISNLVNPDSIFTFYKGLIHESIDDITINEERTPFISQGSFVELYHKLLLFCCIILTPPGECSSYD